jgi:hypothetical protein
MESNHPGPFIRRAFAPTVLVIANQDAEDACKKSAADLSVTAVLDACGTTVPPSRGMKSVLKLAISEKCRLWPLVAASQDKKGKTHTTIVYRCS